MLESMKKCFDILGVKPGRGNKGRCSRCIESAKVIGVQGRIGWLWCYKYNSFCANVARNCKE